MDRLARLQNTQYTYTQKEWIAKNRLTAIDANWRQIRMTLKRRGRQMASWMPHLTLMLISREGYELGP